jgi:hypothetical protein
MPWNSRKCNSLGTRNASCCNAPKNACCGKNGCLGSAVHGEVAVPCPKRMALNAQRKKVNSMANTNVNKGKEQMALQRMMEGMRNIWEPICGDVDGGKRKTRRNRGNRNKTRRS